MSTAPDQAFATLIPDAQDFCRQLAANNTRDWYMAHKEVYQTRLKRPAEELLEVLRPHGRYAVSGAIAGPMVELDVRTLYLKDLSFFGCTVLEPEVFGNLVRLIELGKIKPLVAETYALADIAKAQTAFAEKNHIGKIVLAVADAI